MIALCGRSYCTTPIEWHDLTRLPFISRQETRVLDLSVHGIL